MATLNHKEASIYKASKHAKRSWICTLCGKVCYGNGGKASHKNKHLKEAGLSKRDWDYLTKKDNT